MQAANRTAEDRPNRTAEDRPNRTTASLARGQLNPVVQNDARPTVTKEATKTPPRMMFSSWRTPLCFGARCWVNACAASARREDQR